MEPALDIAKLEFRWPGQAEACLRIEQLRVERGASLFLHGPSGSGKSTLLGLLGGVLTAQTGTLRVLGADLRAMSGAQRDRFRGDHIGFIFQQFNLIPYLSVLDNVTLPCGFSAVRAQRAAAQGDTLRAAAQTLLEHLDLPPESWSRPVTQLSVGQQQRVAAARALMGRPELVIADEPTSALDADRQAAFLALLTRECAAAGATLVFVSHDIRLAAFCRQTIAMHELDGAPVAPALP